MALGGQLYNLVFKSSSRYFLTLVIGAFALERVVDGACDSIFDSINRGRQWKDIQHLYVKSAEADEE